MLSFNSDSFKIHAIGLLSLIKKVCMTDDSYMRSNNEKKSSDLQSIINVASKMTTNIEASQSYSIIQVKEYTATLLILNRRVASHQLNINSTFLHYFEAAQIRFNNIEQHARKADNKSSEKSNEPTDKHTKHSKSLLSSFQR